MTGKLLGDNGQMIGCVEFEADVENRYAPLPILQYGTITFLWLRRMIVLMINNVIETQKCKGCGDIAVCPPFM